MSFRTFLILFIFLSACKTLNPDEQGSMLQIFSVEIDGTLLSATETTIDINTSSPIKASFSSALDTATVINSIQVLDEQNTSLPFNALYDNDRTTVSLFLVNELNYATDYTLLITDQLKGSKGEQFKGIDYTFQTQNGSLKLDSIKLNGANFDISEPLTNINFDIEIVAYFSDPLNEQNLADQFRLNGFGDTNLTLSIDDSKKVVTFNNTTPLIYLSKFEFVIRSTLTSDKAYSYSGFSNIFYTELGNTYQFPQITDEELLTKIQEQTFKYFWDFGHPVSGLARERNTSGETVTSGGSGFGIMAIIVGIERGFITRQEGVERWTLIVDFLKNKADRFHGVWPHWLNGTTGQVQPFSTKDNGGDLVETSFLTMGLLTVRQYLDPNVPDEKTIIDNINQLWNEIEWDWYTQGQNTLYWHWSPNYNFEINMQIRGWNEALITHVLAASSTTHTVNDNVYHSGWANNGNLVNGGIFYGFTLPLGPDFGGPMFFEHYSFLGLNPTNLTDQYANYWNQAVNHAKINHAYCVDNPKNWLSYSDSNWGLTASDSHQGYAAHSPTNDLGVISPTAAISSIAFTPAESMDAIRHFYYLMGDRIWGQYGFYDAFNVTENWYASSYLAIDQGPIIIMIENQRTGLLWNLFMSNQEVKGGLDKLGFQY